MMEESSPPSQPESDQTSQGRSTSKWMRRGGIVCLVLLAVFGAKECAVTYFGGAFSHMPSEMEEGLSEEGMELIRQAFDGIESSRLLDYHAHVIGLGAGGTGAFVHPNMTSWLYPMEKLRFEVYASASAIEDLEDADAQYMARLVDLIENIEGHGRYHLLAFDKYHDHDGNVDLDRTPFFVPNEYVFSLVNARKDLFVPTASIHPYRKDALAALDEASRHGARFVKWLPNSMGIDPADPKCDLFYERMAELEMILLSHAGDEFAVQADEGQDLGNPLRLRRALDKGVKVVVAHCASLGEGEDLDHPENEKVNNFALFLRLMEDPQYDGLVFGEISAVAQANRLPGPLMEILAREDLHGRLVNGSDYPLPAVNVVLRTGDLVDGGFITDEEREALNEIYDYNPLLFDFVLKRVIRHPDTGQGFAASVFMENPGLMGH
jgi:predicted TIM-barrel fold metal-dependent hydrolase